MLQGMAGRATCGHGAATGWGHVTGRVKATCGSRMMWTGGGSQAGAVHGRAVRSYPIQSSDPRISMRELQDGGIKEF